VLFAGIIPGGYDGGWKTEVIAGLDRLSMSNAED
jgi:hypothetical protein